MLSAAALATSLSLATGGAATVDLSFGTDQAARRTTMDLRLVYFRDGDPDGKPPAAPEIRVDAPEGTRFDTSAAEVCTASDDELRARNRSACPAGSEIGGGRLTVMTGAGAPVDPVPTDLTLFNGGDHIIELASFPGTRVTGGFDRLAIDGSSLTAAPPALPGGPPDFRTVVREVAFSITAPGFVTAPALCEGRWRYGARIGFADGSRSTPSGELDCRPAPVRLRVTARRGARSAVVRAVLDTIAECRAGAEVRAAGRRTVSDAAGVARLRIAVRRRRSVTVVATRRGCGTGRAVVRLRSRATRPGRPARRSPSTTRSTRP